MFQLTWLSLSSHAYIEFCLTYQYAIILFRLTSKRVKNLLFKLFISASAISRSKTEFHMLHFTFHFSQGTMAICLSSNSHPIGYETSSHEKHAGSSKNFFQFGKTQQIPPHGNDQEIKDPIFSLQGFKKTFLKGLQMNWK